MSDDIDMVVFDEFLRVVSSGVFYLRRGSNYYHRELFDFPRAEVVNSEHESIGGAQEIYDIAVELGWIVRYMGEMVVFDDNFPDTDETGLLVQEVLVYIVKATRAGASSRSALHMCVAGIPLSQALLMAENGVDGEIALAVRDS